MQESVVFKNEEELKNILCRSIGIYAMGIRLL